MCSSLQTDPPLPSFDLSIIIILNLFMLRYGGKVYGREMRETFETVASEGIELVPHKVVVFEQFMRGVLIID